MDVHDALREMQPSLALQRAALDHIARLEKRLNDASKEIEETKSRLAEFMQAVSSLLTEEQLDERLACLGGRTARSLFK